MKNKSISQIVRRPAAMLAWVCGLGLMGSAQALSPAQVDSERYAGYLKEIRLVGADGPAMRAMLGRYIQTELAQPGSLDVFFSEAAGVNHRAYSFRLKVATGGWAAGTPVLVTKRDQGGASNGVRALAKADVTQLHMRVDSSCTAAAGGASPASDIAAPGFLCASTMAGYADAGFSELEPSLFERSINNGSGAPTTGLNIDVFAQSVFGVAVNKKLYLALQKTQGLIDMSAVAIDESPAKQPNLFAPFVRGALTGQLMGSDPTQKGWNLVVSPQVDADVLSKKINVCRGKAGLAMQAASNVYFANNPCENTGGVYAPSSAGGTIAAVGMLAVNAGASSTAIEACLGQTVDNAAGTAYGLGVLGADSQPFVTVNGSVVDKGYRFIKLNGAAPTHADAAEGSSEFVFDSTMQWAKTGASAPVVDKLQFLELLRKSMVAAPILAGLNPEIRNGLIALGRNYIGVRNELPVELQLYISRSSRGIVGSCSPMRLSH